LSPVGWDANFALLFPVLTGLAEGATRLAPRVDNSAPNS